MDNQFYPTPFSLGLKAFNKFKTKRIKRLLEPNAGRGDLLEIIKNSGWRCEADCIEIDLDNQAILRSKKHRVIAGDFLKFKGAALYSHIFMNPPFASGVKHVLHAWDLLYNGEIVAIVNAETVKNAHSKEKKFLVELITNHGSVEFVQSAFTTADTFRQTAVEVAIIHLEKKSDFKAEFLDGLRAEVEQEPEESLNYNPQELTVPKSTIDNLVTAFNAAVIASREAAIANSKAKYYSGMLGKSILDDSTSNASDLYESTTEEFNSNYTKLKGKAWSSVLRSSDVLNKLSSAAQKRLEAEFETIRDLEFTVDNILGFLLGLVNQQGEIQIEMICDVFDEISRYHPENRAYYQGWKSNKKHRVNAFRVLMTRFILPCKDLYNWDYLSFDDRQRLRDFDKVFAMLDSKAHSSIYGVEQLFDDKEKSKELSCGQRLASDYFEMRYYPGAGTYHFFPKRKDLIGRLNRVVGQHRAWLPPQGETVNPDFWVQFDQAEKITKKMGKVQYDEWGLLHGDDARKELEAEKILDAHNEAMAKLKIHYNPDLIIEDQREEQLLLA